MYGVYVAVAQLSSKVDQAVKFAEELRATLRDLEIETEPEKRKLGSASKWTVETQAALQIFFVPTTDYSLVVPARLLPKPGVHVHVHVCLRCAPWVPGEYLTYCSC